MRQPHHAGRYRIDEIEPPAELLTEGETEEVKGGNEWGYFSSAPSLFGPLDPKLAFATEATQATQEAS